MNEPMYMSFYETEPTTMGDWTNLAHDWDLGLLVTLAERGVQLLPDVSFVFFFQTLRIREDGARDWGRLALRKDYLDSWKAFVSLIRPLVRRRVVAGFFLGD